MLWVELINLIILLTNNPHSAAVAEDLGFIQACQTFPWMKPKTIYLKCDMKNFIIHFVWFRK